MPKEGKGGQRTTPNMSENRLAEKLVILNKHGEGILARMHKAKVVSGIWRAATVVHELSFFAVTAVLRLCLAKAQCAVFREHAEGSSPADSSPWCACLGDFPTRSFAAASRFFCHRGGVFPAPVAGSKDQPRRCTVLNRVLGFALHVRIKHESIQDFSATKRPQCIAAKVSKANLCATTVLSPVPIVSWPGAPGQRVAESERSLASRLVENLARDDLSPTLCVCVCRARIRSSRRPSKNFL